MAGHSNSKKNKQKEDRDEETKIVSASIKESTERERIREMWLQQ